MDPPAEGVDPTEVRAVFQWHGHTAPLRVKASALLLAHTVRSIDRRGRCDVHVVGNAEPPGEPEGAADAAMLPSQAGPALSTNSFSKAFKERTVLKFYMAIEEAANGPPAPPP